MTRVPFLIGAIAYTPRPWMRELRASTSGDVANETFFFAALRRLGAEREDERGLPRDFLRLFFVAMKTLDGYRRLDARMRLVIEDLKIVVLVFED
jgi:hypothetical protein